MMFWGSLSITAGITDAIQLDAFDEIEQRIDSYSGNIGRDNQRTAIANLSADEMCISYRNLSREEISSDDEDPGQERSAFNLFDFDG